MSLPDRIASGYHWRKALRSANDGACVEVALVNSQVVVRDSKDPDGPWQRYPARSWRDFIATVKRES